MNKTSLGMVNILNYSALYVAIGLATRLAALFEVLDQPDVPITCNELPVVVLPANLNARFVVSGWVLFSVGCSPACREW